MIISPKGSSALGFRVGSSLSPERDEMVFGGVDVAAIVIIVVDTLVGSNAVNTFFFCFSGRGGGGRTGKRRLWAAYRPNPAPRGPEKGPGRAPP